MISDFLWLDLVEKTDAVIHCFCSLPDPNPYSKEEMVQCGDILYTSCTATNDAVITIKLFSNFKELCIGDFYQRKDFVNTILLILQMNYGALCEKPYINLVDSWGSYSGYLEAIDNSIRSVE